MKKIFTLFIVFLLAMLIVNAHGDDVEEEEHSCPMHSNNDDWHEEMHEDLDEDDHDEIHESMHIKNNNWFSGMFRRMFLF